jgi:MFS family permease
MNNRLAQRLDLGLSRELWLIAIGIFLNNLGYGAVLPFEVIYLHNGRGFSLGVAGLVVGLITGVAVLISPSAGSLIDRFGARTAAIGAGVALAVGYAGLAFATTPVVAFAAAALAGVGNGVLNPSQSTLLAVLTPPDSRHRVTALSRVASNAGIGLGGALSGFVAAYGLNGFILLFLANALTYLIYMLVLAAVVRDDIRSDSISGGYRLLLGDGAFLRLALINVAIIAVGWGAFTWLVPPYAQAQIGISPTLIGLLLLANAVTVVIAQIPVSRFAEGRRRVVMMAVAALLFVFACLLIATAGLWRDLGYPALVMASILVGVGECFHTTVLMPLVADLAPPSLRGRYMAAVGLSWWVGLALAPTLGTQVMSLSPRLAFVAGAVVTSIAAVSALALEQRLPETSRMTPHPQHGQAVVSPSPD